MFSDLCNSARDMAPEPGSAAPDFVIERGVKAHMRLSDLRGQPVVLAFFPAGWDPARQEQIAQYNSTLSRMPGRTARLTGIDHNAMHLATGREQWSVPLVADFDPTGDVASLYGVAGLQALFLVDSAGTIRWRYIAPVGALVRADALTAGLAALSPDTPADESPGKERGRSVNLPLTRREFVAAAVAAAMALALPSAVAAQAAPEAPPGSASTLAPISASPVDPLAIPVTLNVNGESHNLRLDPRVTLLDALRERIGLTGSKKGCDHGQCGACTVHIGGRRVLSCLTLAASAQSAPIVTIEGLANGDTLHPIQAAFITHDGFQCGFCTPGQIMSAAALINEAVGDSDDDVREMMSGNICRCGAYPNIVAAIQDVRGKGAANGAV